VKLVKTHVTEFESIRDSKEFEINDITCLVGKNEAGKTAVLQAIYRLNPIIESEGKFDVTSDYPRADVEDYQHDVESEKRKSAIVIKATFQLDELELKEIESEFGVGIINKPYLELSKGYENNLIIGLTVDEKIATTALINSASLPTELAEAFTNCDTLASLQKQIDTLKENTEKFQLVTKLNTQLDRIRKALGLVLYIWENHLKKHLPKFLYFDEYYQMRGHENIESLLHRVSQKSLDKSDYPLLGLIELARLKLEELKSPPSTQWLTNKLEGASNHLTKRILDYWSQNKHIGMKFDVRPATPGDPVGMRTGNNLWASVYDSNHKVTTLLGTRSKGFVWFFSFLAWFDQQQKKKEPLILLLDEPGLFLHGKAQGDLLNFIEKELRSDHQVIYTTHSPFMVDPRVFERVRIVQDRGLDEDQVPKGEEGTKVFTDINEASNDSLFPLQGALGYEIHQTLFVGPNSLIVEGVSDLLYLETISGVLHKLGRAGLSPKWVITPVGGSDKIPTFVALLGSQKKLNIATLIDIQKKDKQPIENLYKKKLLNKKNVLTFGDFTGSSEADIEDMFSPSFYLTLVNGEYKHDLSSSIEEKGLTSKHPRIIVRLDEYLKQNPLKSGALFNHYRPARFFLRGIDVIASSIPKGDLDRFENAFKSANSLL